MAMELMEGIVRIKSELTAIVVGWGLFEGCIMVSFVIVKRDRTITQILSRSMGEYNGRLET